MKILIAYFSRTGNTEQLARKIGDELVRRGHTIEYEAIKPAVYHSIVREALRDFPRWPSIALSLFVPIWRTHHLRTYNQVEAICTGSEHVLLFHDQAPFSLL